MWVLAILLQISHGQKYFSSIKNSLHWISSRTLSVRLKELQKYDFIVREIVSEQPLKIEYSLTQKWKSFSKELQHLSKWAEKWG
jgi:DNA-binding HxlR family transcriptional regulator